MSSTGRAAFPLLGSTILLLLGTNQLHAQFLEPDEPPTAQTAVTRDPAEAAPAVAGPVSIPSGAYLPPRPPEHVLDLAGILSPEQVDTLSSDLVRSAESAIHIFVLTLETAPPVDLPTYADQLRDSWLDDGLGAVVFVLADRDEFPRILTGGRDALALGANRVDLAAVRAAERAGLEPDLPSRLSRAALELRDELTILHHRLARQTGRAGEGRSTARPAIMDQVGELIVAILGAILFITLLFLALSRAKPRPRLFPEVEPRLRLGAPHSGGNNASVSFRPKRSRT